MDSGLSAGGQFNWARLTVLLASWVFGEVDAARALRRSRVDMASTVGIVLWTS